MVTLFNTAISSPIIIGLTILYCITESIATYDIRLIQWKKHGTLPHNTQLLPKWTGVFTWLSWLVLVALIFLNWKYAIAVFIIAFILKVLPVLETIGKLLVTPFRSKK